MRRLFASITARVRGTRTPATATSAECSFCCPPGAASGEWVRQIALPHESSFTDLSSSGGATVVPGSSGAQGGSVVSDSQQRILAVGRGSSLPRGWRFVQLVGKETNPLTHQWEDLVLCEFREESA